MFGELEAKAAVLNYLLEKKVVSPHTSILINEMTLAKKTRRLDLAYIEAGRLVAIEVKSQRDTLVRLAGQLEQYRKYFDKVVLAVAPKFVDYVLANVCDDIAVWSVVPNGVKVVRRGRINRRVDKFDYVDLMTKSELVSLARVLNVDQDLPAYELKHAVLKDLARLSKPVVKKVLVDSLSKKFELSTYRFMKSVSHSNVVVPSDISLLSAN